MSKTILAIGAHNDDHIIGAGGTLIKYAKDGKKVKTVVFSFGDASHPHLKPEVIISKRVQEARESDKLMGGSGLTWLGAYDVSFEEDIVRLGLKEKLVEIMRKERPEKIFCHAPDDAHPNHRSVHRVVMAAVKDSKIKTELFSYEVWNVITMKNRNKPKLVVDTTQFFKRKIEAFKLHESQQTTILILLWKVYIRDFVNGWNNGCKYAEVFVKLL